MNVTAHVVVPDADEAGACYQRAFGALEEGRVPLPAGKVMTVQLRFGDSTGARSAASEAAVLRARPARPSAHARFRTGRAEAVAASWPPCRGH